MKRTLLLLLIVPALHSCKMMEAVDSTIDMKNQMSSLGANTSDMKGETKKLTNAIHLQKMDAALGTMRKPENTKNILPPSVGLLAGAKVFSEEGTAEELLEFYKVSMKEIDKLSPDNSKKVNGVFPPDYIAGLNHDKDIIVLQLQAVAAQTPQTTIQTMVDTEVFNGGGEYEQLVYGYLMLRYSFVEDLFIKEGVLADSAKIDNVGKLKALVKYTRWMDFIATLPFVNKIEFKTKGFIKPAANKDLNLVRDSEFSSVKDYWERIVTGIDKELPKEYKAGNSPYARDISELRDLAARKMKK